jgi:glyoxalase family protein
LTNEKIPGIHHITAIASDPQRNLDFYTGVLGLRLVKRTVNFDDPGTYHFYFGDERGAPGTILTFFPWPDIRAGRAGTSEVGGIAFAVAPGTRAAWTERLRAHGVTPDASAVRFGEPMLAFTDPDGTRLELIERPSGGVPAGADPNAIRGFHSATLVVPKREKTEALLADTFGFEPAGDDGGRRRFRAASGGPGALVDVVESHDGHAELGAGSVHHIAWRTRDDDSQADWLHALARQKLHVTPVQDRQYFHSIYFREPGGVLFEIATDPPGFALDESPERLGHELKLPEWLEPMRDRIERSLPAIHVAEPESSR